jgi:alpha-L-arabinofuranosidase
VFVINRDPGEHHEARIDVSGFHCAGRARVHGVAADGYSAENTVEDPEAVAERASEIEWKGHLRFPPCSVTALVLES